MAPPSLSVRSEFSSQNMVSGGPLDRVGVFTPAGKGTHVDFVIDFQFKSHLLDHVANNMFHEAATRMMDAFEARAHLVHFIMQRHRVHSSS
jgi:hypothetical protein